MCGWRGPHRHDGRAGCRCSGAELAAWHEQAEENWTRLLQVVQQRIDREFGRRAPVIVRVWEPQERGAWHLHVVVSVKGAGSEVVALRFGAHLRSEAGRLRFGDVLGFGLADRSGRINRKVYAKGRSTGRYLAGYFVDDATSRKPSLLESVREARWTPRRVAWVSPKLTARSGITMRVMRLSRRWWAARRGLCSYPDTERCLSPSGRRCPLLALVRLHGRAARPELLCFSPRVLELRSSIGVNKLTGLDPLEAVPLQEPRVRCFQQRPGNSTRPEVDVPAPVLANWVLDRDVRDLESTARP